MRYHPFCKPSGSLPSIDNVPVTPLDPIAHRTAVARSEGQGRRHFFRRTDTSCDDARPENVGRRRSPALDRSEHDGRLMGNRGGGPCAANPAIMTLLAACMIVTAFPFAAPAGEPDIGTPNDADPWSAHITEAARRFAIPEQWIRTVMHAESDHDPHAISPKGAIGLMQIMPATWEELRTKHGLGNDPYDVHDNILAGASYLRELHDRYGNVPAMLVAYNAGPGRYERHFAGAPLPAETVEYVAKIMSMIDTDSAFPLPSRRQSAGSETAGGPLFAVTTNGISASHSSLFTAPPAIKTDDGQTADDHPSGRPSSVSTITDLSALAPPSDDLFIPRSHHGVTE